MIKRFLLSFTVLSLAGWALGLVLFGPPGLSKSYLEGVKNPQGAFVHPPMKEQHARFLKIEKSEAYQWYLQRPALNKGRVSEEDLNFLREYEENERFVQEERRIEHRQYYYDFFNCSLFVVLIAGLAWKPLLSFIDRKIVELRDEMERLKQERAAAEERKKKALADLAGLEERRKNVARDTRIRLDKELALLDAENSHSMAVMQAEMEGRKGGEEHAAAMQLRRDMVQAAIQKLQGNFRAYATPQQQSGLVDQFMDELEALK